MKKLITYAGVLILTSACTPTLDSGEEKKVMNLGKEVYANKAGELYTVKPNEIMEVLPHRGNIPAIDSPLFVSAAEAALTDDEPVIGVAYKNTVRAYPVKVLRWHQVVNDTAGDVHFAVTYDPISNSASVYSRDVLDKTLVFKASARIYNSNPLLFDDTTKSSWAQFTGDAIMGRLSGYRLTMLPSALTSWKAWRSAHADTTVLSQDTGFNRDYSENLYSDYYKSDYLLFPTDVKDERLPAKARVLGLEREGASHAVVSGSLAPGSDMLLRLGDSDILLARDRHGIASASVRGSGEEIPVKESFWFIWTAFHEGGKISGAGETTNK